MRRGDFVLVALPSDHAKLRPALVVQADVPTVDDCGSVAFCPLITYPTGAASFRIAVKLTESNGLRARWEVMVEEVGGVARARLRAVVGELDRATMATVERALPLALVLA